MKPKCIKTVKAKYIHPSSVLPSREHGNDILESVRAVGVQHLLIVRPLHSIPNEYELIDGLGRFKALDPESEVEVEVREGATDAEVFKISEATFKRTQRSTAETATFYATYVEAVKKETNENNAKQIVCRDSCISESQLSQYLAINRLFVKLTQLSSEDVFGGVRKLGINKLYELSKLEDNVQLLEVAKQVEEKADYLALEGISEMVRNACTTALQEVSKKPKVVEEGAADTVAEPEIVAVREKSEPKRQIEPTGKERLDNILDDLARVLKDMEASLSEIRSRDYSEDQLGSDKTKMTLQKISTGLRRLLHYVKTLNEDS